MKTKGIWAIVSALVVLGLLIGGFGCAAEAPAPAPSPAPKPAAPEVITWRGQASWNVGPAFGHFTGDTGPAAFGPVWVNWVKEATGGRLIVDLGAPGSIVPPMEQFSAVKEGVLDVVVPGMAAMYAGEMPEGNVEMGLPFAVQTVEEGWDWLNNWGMQEEFVKVYAKHNIFPVIFTGGTLANFGASFPLDTSEAIKGKKIRASGNLMEYVKMLGGSPVSMPWTDVYMAMKLGTIDAYQGAVGALPAEHLEEVTTHFLVYPNLTTFINNILINKDALNALPDDIKEIIMRDSKYVMHCRAATYWMEQQWQIANLTGITWDRWSEEDTKRITKQTIETVWPVVADISPECARLVEMTEEWARAYGKVD